MLKFRERTALETEARKLDRLLLFDLSVGGHHPGYILHLIRYWGEQIRAGHLDIVVLPRFMEEHGDVVEAASEYPRIRFVPVSGAALSPRSSLLSRKQRAFQEWNLLCKYAKQLQATQCLLLYFDTCQLPLLVGAKPPCPVAGIYFRPTFHYGDFEQQAPSWGEQFHRWREKQYLNLVLRRSPLQTLFCLDPFVVPHLERHQAVKAVHLPDPLKIYGDSSRLDLREELGVESGRTVFLLFGALNERKGLQKLLNSIPLLPKELCEKCCLLLVGPLSSHLRSSVETQIKQLTESLPIQIVSHNQFVTDREIQPYFQLADVILASYQRHIGMSAILVRAAAALKPVLSSDYGLMGEITRRYELGLTVDSTSEAEIAKGLTRMLQEGPTAIGDRHRMAQFAQHNSAEQFAQTIYEHLLKRHLTNSARTSFL